MTDAVLLVRHAAAAAPSGVADRDRELTPEGRRAFARLAEGISREVRLVRVVTSPYARAVATARLLAAATGAEVEEEPALASGASDPAAVLRLARAAGPGVALVGHNPEMGGAIALVSGRDEQVPPGTVAALEPGPGGSLRAMWVRYP